MIGVSIKAGYIELNREPPWLEPVRDGVSRQKVGRGRRQQFVQSCRTRSQPGQPRRRPGAGQRAGLRAPPLRSGRRRRSSRLERPKIGPHSLIEAQHPVRAGAKRAGKGRAPTQRLSGGLAKTPHFTCVGPTYHDRIELVYPRMRHLLRPASEPIAWQVRFCRRGPSRQRLTVAEGGGDDG